MKRLTTIACALSALSALSSLGAVASFAQEGEEPPELEPTSCILCHSDSDMFETEQLEIPESFRSDVHAEVGLSCHDCHGGNADAEIADDMDAAMDDRFAKLPYVGVPSREEIPGYCGRCHSDPSYMKRFRPDPRVDQEREYWTSLHGQALEAGDGNVATCISCHGVHGIRRPTEPDSLVYPTRVADTCGGCHADPDRMSDYTLANGTPLPIDQKAKWERSVHAQSMFEKEDLTAPTCNDCHGNHGATPPGVDSIAFVCGQCHGREADIFRRSPKSAGLNVHNEFLAEAEGEGCPACHEAPEPQAAVTDVHSFSECASCHGNHGIIRPTIGMLSPPPPTPCDFCHNVPEELEAGLLEPEKEAARQAEVQAALIDRADSEGVSGTDMFNWLIDRALELPEHTLDTELEDSEGTARLRPEFSRLFNKFRIGKTYYTYDDPVTGEPVQASVTRCEGCHAKEPLMADEPVGFETSRAILDRMQELTSLTATAERVLLRARRGGVETRDAVLEIDQAVDAQIGLEVLVHAFDVSEGSEFATRHAEGLEHAHAALDAGNEALDQLAFRRKGLAVSLIIIFVVLISLGLKIRELSNPAN